MLWLDSPLWAQLDHTYGRAGDIPDLLRRLEASPPDEVNLWTGVWNELWESLCHGGIEVHTASYAALPHLIRIGRGAAPDARWGYFLYAAQVETLRRRCPGPAIPDFIREGYFAALRSLHEWAYELASEPWDAKLSAAISAALLASKGQPEWASLLIDATPEMLPRLRRLVENHGDRLDEVLDAIEAGDV